MAVTPAAVVLNTLHRTADCPEAPSAAVEVLIQRRLQEKNFYVLRFLFQVLKLSQENQLFLIWVSKQTKLEIISINPTCDK